MLMPSSGLETLRRFMRPRAPREQCELCGEGLTEEHSHLLELANRQLHCACEACALLFDSANASRYRRIPRGVRLLTDFRMSDVQWEDLHLPINLAFFLHSTPAGRVLALYPSPAGATEAQPTPEAWQTLVEDNPILRKFKPDVEALLVNRLRPAPEYYRLGIDQCYRLVGVIRTHWKGLSGAGVWKEIERLFTALRERAQS